MNELAEPRVRSPVSVRATGTAHDDKRQPAVVVARSFSDCCAAFGFTSRGAAASVRMSFSR